MRKKLFSLFLLVMVAVTSVQPVYATSSSELKKQREEKERLAKERQIQTAILNIKKQFGKNAILKGLNYEEGATAKERNEQIGGHKA